MENMQGRDGHVRTDNMLDRLGAGWTVFFLAKLYPELSRYIIKEFVRTTSNLSKVVILAIFVIFGTENFEKGPALLLTHGLQNLRLDGLLTLTAMIYGKLGGFIALTRYPEKLRESVTKI